MGTAGENQNHKDLAASPLIENFNFQESFLLNERLCPLHSSLCNAKPCASHVGVICASHLGS
jgi:hypothetical protein